MPLGVEAWPRCAAIPMFAIALPWRCALMPPPPDVPDMPVVPEAPDALSAVEPKQEAPVSRVTGEPPRATASEAIALPDEVVVRAIDAGQPAFLRCWARAQRLDPPDIEPKVRLHLELDAAGKVTAIASDSESPTLSRCIAVVARHLPFPAPGQPAVVDVPLIFP